MKRIIIGVVLLFTLLFCFQFFLVPVMADSGWDSDYSSDSGSSWSDSDYGGSWNDHDYSHSSSSSGSSGSISIAELIVLLTVVIFIFVMVVLANILVMSTPRYRQKKAYTIYVDHTKLVQQFFPEYTERQLINMLYEIFLKIQNAWMNFDYDALKQLCSDELYQSYKSDLEVLKLKNGQNIMNDFCLESASIKDISEDNGVLIITALMHVSFYDYVIDTKSGVVTRGNKQKILYNQYELTFVYQKELLVDKCPNCGSPLTGNECSFCHTVVNTGSKGFLLSKKEKIG